MTRELRSNCLPCPVCRSIDGWDVLDSRVRRGCHDGKVSIRRRRRCKACAQRFTTYESIVQEPLSTISEGVFGW